MFRIPQKQIRMPENRTRQVLRQKQISLPFLGLYSKIYSFLPGTPLSSQDFSSNRVKIPKTTTPGEHHSQGRKKLAQRLQNLKNAVEKQTETLEKELNALFRYYKEAVTERVHVELSQSGGSRNAFVAALLEESCFRCRSLLTRFTTD